MARTSKNLVRRVQQGAAERSRETATAAPRRAPSTADLPPGGTTERRRVRQPAQHVTVTSVSWPERRVRQWVVAAIAGGAIVGAAATAILLDLAASSSGTARRPAARRRTRPRRSSASTAVGCGSSQTRRTASTPTSAPSSSTASRPWTPPTSTSPSSSSTAFWAPITTTRRTPSRASGFARLAVSGIRLVIEEFRADVTKTRKDGANGALRIDTATAASRRSRYGGCGSTSTAPGQPARSTPSRSW
jgi:hypothetical protein